MKALLLSVIWMVLILGLAFESNQARNFKSDSLAVAEEDLKIAKKMNDRSKKLVHDLNAHIRRLSNRVRTGKTLRTVIRKKPKKDPFQQLRMDILTSDLRKTRAAPL